MFFFSSKERFKNILYVCLKYLSYNQIFIESEYNRNDFNKVFKISKSKQKYHDE